MIASVIIHLSDAAHLTIIQDTQRRGWKSNMPVSRRHPTLEASDMSVIERLAKTSFRIPAPSQSVLLVVVIAAYIFMHVVAGVMLINAAATAVKSTREEVQPRLQSIGPRNGSQK